MFSIRYSSPTSCICVLRTVEDTVVLEQVWQSDEADYKAELKQL